MNFPNLVFTLLCSVAISPLLAAPFTPKADTQVLERLPARADDPRMREIAELRRQLARAPADAPLAVKLSQRLFEQSAAEGDPRFVGYAQAALAPWWALADPPAAVRLQRAVLLQFNHEFERALLDLQATVKEEPGNAQAWAWIAAIHMVRAQYPAARAACQRMAANTSALIANACTATADAHSGQASAAAAALQTALRGPAPAPEQLWALTRLAETLEQLGDAASAESAYRRALALALPDVYLLSAYADFLLDQGRAAEVLVLLKDKQRADVLLLRLALAAKAMGSTQLKAWAEDLAARFAAARLRGDSTHLKEEARFALAVQGDAQRAVKLAAENYTVQREPADARILLEAAVAARQPEAAEPALAWLRASHIEHRTLAALAARLQARP